ncbi:MAG: aldo/keto reductase [Lachnospiraceae bacterium]
MENKYYTEIKKNFGFGCMRLPMNGDEVDYQVFSQMIDKFMECGFNYFDTAHGYLNGQSEIAIGKCLTSCYPRDSYVLANKLTDQYFQSREDIRPFLESQLKICGVEYFDFYLMHAQSGKNYKKFQDCKAYETAMELKREGKIKHVGISFHDRADMLEKILCDHPEIEVVQIQFNYKDYEDPSIESRKVYETALAHGKKVIVMEPVKGGSLADLPKEAEAVLDKLGEGKETKPSYASYAIRFAAGFPEVIMVLSGMGDMDMMNDNVSYMKDFIPLNEAETEAVFKVRDIIDSKKMIPCTDCRYCMEKCPKRIRIPALFAGMNERKIYGGSSGGYYYIVNTSEGNKASDCLKCGVCEYFCPQHLPIRKLLEQVAEEFDQEQK